MAGGKPAWAKDARTGEVRDYLEQKVFACEGMIVVIDHRPQASKEGECVVLPCDVAESRAHELMKDYRGQTRVQQPKGLRDLWTMRVNGCQNILECVKEARRMGDPTDPQVQAFWRKHRTNRVASFAQAGARQSRHDILNKVARRDISSTMLDSRAKPKLILPAGAQKTSVTEYAEPTPKRKVDTHDKHD